MTLDEITEKYLKKPKVTSIKCIEDENLYLWQLNDFYADEINRLREVNAELRLIIANNNIEVNV